MSKSLISYCTFEKRFQFITAHLICCLLGFVGSVSGFCYLVAKKLSEHTNHSLPYTFWAKMTLATQKPAFMTAYLAGAAAIFIYIVCSGIYVLAQKDKQSPLFRSGLSNQGLLIFLSIELVVNIMLFWKFMVFKPFTAWILLTALWSVFFALPFCKALVNRISTIKFPLTEKQYSIGLLLTAVLLFMVALVPFLQMNHLKISNDFLWVPETTLMQGRVIDNNQYVMQQGIGGLFSNLLIHSKQDIDVSKYNVIPLLSQPHFNALDFKAQMLTNEEQNVTGIEPDFQSRFFYNNELKVLFEKTNANISPSDSAFLCTQVSKEDCKAIQMFHSKQHDDYSNEALSFIHKNAYELSNQVVVGHYFYHQYAMLGPLNELLLGKTPATIMFLYGWGNTHTLAAYLKYFNSDLNFSSYTASMYSLYFLYYMLLVLVSVLIFKNVRYVTFVAVASIALFFMMGFELIRMAPGFNPLRHFLDLPLIILFVGYLQSQRLSTFYLIGAYGVAWLAVIANEQFGLMMLLSLTGAVSLHILLSSKRYSDCAYIVISFLLTFVALHYIHAISGHDQMALYSLLGVSVSPVSGRTICVLLGAIILLYLSLFGIAFKKNVHHKPIYLLLFLFFYSQCLWLYYVWYTEIGHLASTSAIWLLCLVLFYREVSTSFSNYAKEKKVLNGFLLLMLSSLLAYASFKYFHEQKRYDEIFTTHKVYQWDFKRARFLSTMDPTVFNEAVGLIHQYSDTNAIYMISKYDMILPYLAEKYSAMPYSELITSLVTNNEIKIAVNAILQTNPRYIFVDTDIKDAHMGDIIDPSDATLTVLDHGGLSFGRAIVLREMRRVFYEIEPNYKLIKQGFLISVYEHK